MQEVGGSQGRCSERVSSFVGLTAKSIPNCLSVSCWLHLMWFISVPVLSLRARTDACLHCGMAFTPRLKWQLTKTMPSVPRFQKFANTQALGCCVTAKGGEGKAPFPCLLGYIKYIIVWKLLLNGNRPSSQGPLLWPIQAPPLALCS